MLFNSTTPKQYNLYWMIKSSYLTQFYFYWLNKFVGVSDDGSILDTIMVEFHYFSPITCLYFITCPNL
jgi:hypothetical protein